MLTPETAFNMGLLAGGKGVWGAAGLSPDGWQEVCDTLEDEYGVVIPEWQPKLVAE